MMMQAAVQSEDNINIKDRFEQYTQIKIALFRNIYI